MMVRDRERLQKLRVVVRYLLVQDALEHGHQSWIARHFRLSRQRVHQIVLEERERRASQVAALDHPDHASVRKTSADRRWLN